MHDCIAFIPGSLWRATCRQLSGVLREQLARPAVSPGCVPAHPTPSHATAQTPSPPGNTHTHLPIHPPSQHPHIRAPEQPHDLLPPLPQSLLGRSVPRSGGSLHGGRQFARSPSARQLAALAAAGRKGASVHGAGEYWRVMRAASELAAMGELRVSHDGAWMSLWVSQLVMMGHGLVMRHHYLRTAPCSEEVGQPATCTGYPRLHSNPQTTMCAESGHGQHHYLRTAPRSEEERAEQRKAARLSLDTSAHGGDHFADLLKRLESARSEELAHKASFGE